jgi:hypothetical protein
MEQSTIRTGTIYHHRNGKRFLITDLFAEVGRPGESLLIRANLAEIEDQSDGSFKSVREHLRSDMWNFAAHVRTGEIEIEGSMLDLYPPGGVGGKRLYFEYSFETADRASDFYWEWSENVEDVEFEHRPLGDHIIRAHVLPKARQALIKSAKEHGAKVYYGGPSEG